MSRASSLAGDEERDGDREHKKPFVCPLCGQSFTRRDNLANHIKVRNIFLQICLTFSSILTTHVKHSWVPLRWWLVFFYYRPTLVTVHSCASIATSASPGKITWSSMNESTLERNHMPVTYAGEPLHAKKVSLTTCVATQISRPSPVKPVVRVSSRSVGCGFTRGTTSTDLLKKVGT